MGIAILVARTVLQLPLLRHCITTAAANALPLQLMEDLLDAVGVGVCGDGDVDVDADVDGDGDADADNAGEHRWVTPKGWIVLY